MLTNDNTIEFSSKFPRWCRSHSKVDLVTLLVKFILWGPGGNVCRMSPLFKVSTNFALYCDVCGAQRPVREKLKKCAAMIEELLKERDSKDIRQRQDEPSG